mgnify:CR=1 FL=1
MSHKKQELFLVPFDFTQSTKDALHYAIHLAKLIGGKVMMLNLVKHQNDMVNAKVKMKWEVDHLPEDEQELVTYKAMPGNIFDDLDKVGHLVDATYIVMGTHGATGLQRIFGSNTLKVVSNSRTPFIIIQEGQTKDHIESIVMPFSFDRESLQVTQVAALIAHDFGATIHLVGYRDEDEHLFRDAITNEAIVRKFLTEHGIKHDTKILQGEKGYEEELLDYAQSVNADLIAAAYFHKGLRTYLHSFVQAMIENDKKIPVLTINAQEFMTLNSRFSFITT